MLNQQSANNQFRSAFWTVGIVVGATLTYLTRYYLNTDGLIYLEIGDAVRSGNWGALVNHQWSPAYSVVLAFAQWCLNTTLYNELVSLKFVNFIIFIGAMWTCEFFIKSLRASLMIGSAGDGSYIPFGLVRLVLYGAFLVAALVWIRIRLMSPDMLMLAYLLLATALILRIKTNPEGFGNFILLGCTLGLSYLTKTYMFVYSGLMIVLAGLAVGSLKKAILRSGLAVMIMAAFSVPLVISLSRDLGRFTYGEAGNYNYALFVASQGELVNPPKKLVSQPQVLLFEEVAHSCFSPGADIAKRYEGKKPRFDLSAQIRALGRNISIIVSDSPWFFLAVFIWGVMQLKWAKPQFLTFVPPSSALTLLAISVTGVLMFTLVLVEMRYIAPFLFMGVAGLAVIWLYRPLKHTETIFRNYTYYGLCMVFLLVTIGSTGDQALRATCPTGSKRAYKDVFVEDRHIAEFVSSKTTSKGKLAGVVESFGMSVYWARLAGVKIIAEIPSRKDYLQATSEDRKRIKRELKQNSVAFLVARGMGFGLLASEGWQKIPLTSEYYLLVTDY